MVRTENNFSNFDKNKRQERSSFNSKQTGEKSGFGARMNNRAPRESTRESTDESHKFGQRGGYRADRGDRGDRNGGDRREGRQRYGGDSDQTLKKQRGPDWIESSEFCRTNVKTGAVMWKEEFWTNPKNDDFVHMCEVKNYEGKPMGFSVPSTWKFQSR